MTINSNYNFGLLSGGGSNLKEIQFTLTADGILSILKSVTGYDLSYSLNEPTGLKLTSNLNKAFVVFCFPSFGNTFRPYLIKNAAGDNGEVSDNAVYTWKVPSNYNTLYFPSASVTTTTSFTFLIID